MSGDRYEEIFEHAPIARLITDRSGVVEEANQAAAGLLRIDADALVGKPLATFVPEEDRREFEERLAAAAGVTTPTTWVMRLAPSGSPALHVELHVLGSQSETGHAHWAITDLTERMAMEEELRRLTVQLEERVAERTLEAEAERARVAAVVEQMPAGLTIVGADGQVVTANAEARRLLGDNVMEVIEDVSVADGETVAGIRAEVEATDGTRVVLEVSAAPIVDTQGRHAGAVYLFHDVSKRERQERAEREFVANAAHQLQSPLAAIVSAIEVLQAGAKEEAERDMFLAHIERETNRLARLARALLILARAQMGHEAPKDEVVALAPLLADVADALHPPAGVRVEVDCDPTTAVVTNRELIEQALMNVAENAAKYTKEGRISLEARLLDGAAELAVSDTGPGIPVGEHPLVLERFYRAAPNGSDGFGLGFAIVSSAMEALGGELELDSKVGSGTRVTLRFPQPASLVET
jgi:PAS domain S-box-containing protein